MSALELLDKLEAAEKAATFGNNLRANFDGVEYVRLLANHAPALLRIARAAVEFSKLCMDYPDDETDAPDYGRIAQEICAAVEAFGREASE